VLKLQPDPMWWNSGGLFFSNDAVLTPKLAVVGGQEPDGHGVVLVWDARTGRPLQRLPFPGGYPDLVNNVRLVPEMSALVARSMNGAIRVWSTQTWQILFERTIGQGGGMEVRPGTTTVVLPVLTSRSGAPIREQGALAFVDLKKRTVRVQPVPGSLYRASYTPDGEILATISSDNRLRLLDGDGKRRADSPEISLPTKPNDVVVDGSGERAAVTLENGQTLIYDISSATLAMPPLVDVDGYEGVNVAWDPRSDLLAIGSMDDSDSQKQGGRVNFWKTGRLTWTTQLCGLAGRDITKAEWERYIPEEDPQSLCSSSS
jgi:WD40 repeat protein